MKEALKKRAIAKAVAGKILDDYDGDWEFSIVSTTTVGSVIHADVEDEYGDRFEVALVVKFA